MADWRNDAYQAQQDAEREWIEEGGEEARAKSDADDWPLCGHCGFSIVIRNPTGFCDHLQYPDYCVTCRVMARTVRVL